jgi:hypothetical protein
MSLQLSNFSLGCCLWDYASNGICIDVLDDFYNVTVSGCYFEINGTTVSSTLTPISGGYRMCCDQADFSSYLCGPSNLIAHGSNDNYEYIEDCFNITSGYIVDLVNYGGDKVDLGFNNAVSVVISSENDAYCSVLSRDAFQFETMDMGFKNLGAYIIGDVYKGPFSDIRDIDAVIYPQSTAFFYGKAYKVVINASDFSGNNMEPFEFEFKIKIR